MEEQNARTTGRVHLTEHVVDLSAHVHNLPCRIAHNGPAPVSTYFKSTPARQAYFRGRALEGSILQLPPDFRGYVLAKAPTDVTVIDNWRTAARFSSLMYWSHDSRPSCSDNCFEWMDVSNLIHGSIFEEEVRSMMVDKSIQGRGFKRKSRSIVL